LFTKQLQNRVARNGAGRSASGSEGPREEEKRIRAVLVDMGGVLVHQDWQGLGAHWGAELGLPAGEFMRALFEGGDEKVLIGQISEEEWWREVGRRLGDNASLRARIEAFLGERERFDYELGEFLASLRSSHRLALVSNAWPGACAHARAHWKLDEPFGDLIFSCEVGLAKPEPAIYRLACERLDVTPADSVFIDDSPENVDAAVALGMRAVPFDTAARVIEQVQVLIASR
jgi:putative hydrolase of the HAD superfamily